ncbi:MAG: PAS domain S-box protein [Balneolaceae bacterium]
MVKEDNIYSTIPLDRISSTILNAINAQITVINPDGNIVAFNRHWKNFRDELEEREQWSHPHLEANILKSLQAPLVEGNDFALRLLLGLKDVLNHEKSTFETIMPIFIHSRKLWFRATVNSLGNDEGVVLIYEDVSSQTQTREYLRETQQKLDKHFDNSLYGILVADKNHTIVEANKAACNLLETTKNDIVYSNITNFLNIDLDVEKIQKKINREGNFIGEEKITTANGKQIPVELSVTLYRNEQGNPVTSWAFKDISDKKVAEQALKVSEQQYKLQFNNTLEGTIIGRPNGLILEVNPAACNILGYTKQELEGKHRDMIFDLSNPINAEAVANRRENGEIRAEVEFTHKDGHKIPVEISSVIFQGEDGTEKTIISVKDISNRKAAAQQLAFETEFIDSAITSLPTAFFVFSRKGKMIRWNNILETELGYTHDEIASMNVLELVHPCDREHLQNLLKGEMSGNQVNIEARCITKDGKTLHYLVRGTSFVQNGERYIVGSGLNRNDFIEIETEKKRNDELLGQLFSNSPNAIVLMGTDGIVQNVNQSFEQLFGFSKKEILGQNLDESIVPDYLDEHAQTLTRMSFMGETFKTEAIRISKDGIEIPVLIGGVPIEVDGEIIAIYGIYVDITDRKNLEDQILELLKTEQKARLHMQEMFEEAPSGIALLEGEDHIYTFANNTFKKLVRKETLEGKAVHEVLPEMNEQGIIELLDTCYAEGKTFHFTEKKVYFNNGDKNHPNIHYLNFVFKPQKNEYDQIYGIFVEAIDVTEQVEARNVIQKSLAEKEILLNEVHHRVKNNLAIISGLLELEMMGTEDENVTRHLYSTQSRISTIAMIHELLYQNESLSHVFFNKYLESLMSDSGKVINKKTRKLVNNFDLGEVILNVNQAIPAGMLLNEIIDCLDEINQVQNNGQEGGFSLSLESDDSQVSIQLRDIENSILPYFNNDENPESDLRMELIEVLLKQIHGTLEITVDENHTLSINFAKREVKGPHNALKN